MQIAIDGPSGSGKSTIAKNLSKILNINYLDTGSMYRAIAYKFLNENIEDLADIENIKAILKNTSIEIIDDQIYLDGVNIENKIRKENIGIMASKISKIQHVRDFLVEKQKEIASKSSIIMDGRDIATVVMPEADFKFFLTANKETRAKRRLNQLKEKGLDSDYNTVLKDLEERDFNDINRENSPLRKADDAIEIDCSDQSVEETLKHILNIIGE